MVDLISPRKKGISFSILLLALEIIFCFSNNHTALFISDYFIFILGFVAIELLNNGLSFTYKSIKWMVLLIWLICASLLFVDILDRGTLLSYAVWLLFLVASANRKWNLKEVYCLMTSFIIGSIIMSVILLVLRHQYRYIGSYRYTIKFFSNMEIDPNYLASFLYIGLIFALYFIFNNKTSKYRAWLLISATVILAAIVMSGSRAAYVAVALSAFGVLVDFLKKSKNKVTIIVILIMMLPILLIIVISLIPPEILSRFNIASLVDGSNKRRVSHWIAAGNAILNNPILGYGAAHTVSILTIYANHSSDAHNTVLTLILHFGLIGAIPIFKEFFDVIKLTLKKKATFIFFSFAGYLFINLIVANHLGISFWIPLILIRQLICLEEKVPSIRE